MTTSLLPSRVARRLQPYFGEEPFLTLREEMDDLFNRFAGGDWNSDWLAKSFAPLFDMVECDDCIEVRMDLPGIQANDLDVEVTGNILRIGGERKEEKEEKKKTYHRVERRLGSFSRSVTLPCHIKENGIIAECHDGILYVKMPKCEEAKSRKIKVKS